MSLPGSLTERRVLMDRRSAWRRATDLAHRDRIDELLASLDALMHEWQQDRQRDDWGEALDWCRGELADTLAKFRSAT